jgi:hypothetical protein
LRWILPAATTKADLLRLTGKDDTKLHRPIFPKTAPATSADDGPSIKGTVAHPAHWIGLFHGWYDDGMSGKKVEFSAPGYKWNQLPVCNAALRTRQADLGWDAARDMLANAHRGLVDWMAKRSEGELYGGPMKGAHNNWTLDRWAEAARASYYRSTAKFVRSALRSS